MGLVVVVLIVGANFMYSCQVLTVQQVVKFIPQRYNETSYAMQLVGFKHAVNFNFQLIVDQRPCGLVEHALSDELDRLVDYWLHYPETVLLGCVANAQAECFADCFANA